MSLDDADRVARGRFYALGMLRIAGAVLAMVGIAAWRGDLLRPGGWAVVGVPLFLAGVAGTLFLPRLLARRWRSPEGP